MSERHSLIAQALIDHPGIHVERLCASLGVSRSWFYYARRVRSVHEEDVDLRDRIEQIVLHNTGYGYRRVTAALRREGCIVNHKRVLRVMREQSLLCRIRRRFAVTTDSAHGHCVYPNLLRDLQITALNQVWIADITYIRLPRRFCYLAAVLDAYSRRCIGWKLSLDLDA